MMATLTRLTQGSNKPNRAVGLKLYLAVIVVLTILPVAIIAIYSFNKSAYGQWPPPGYTTQWYHKLVQQRGQFISAGQFSAILAVAASSLAVVTGGLAAFGVMHAKGAWPSMARAILMSPLGAPKIALGLAGFFVFNAIGQYGSFSELLVVHAVLTMPFAFMVIGAGLARVDKSYEEAARDLGASQIMATVKVVLPQIQRSLAVAWVLSFIMSFDEFDATILLANPTHPTLPISMFTYLQKFADPSMAALSTVLVAASLVLVGFVWMLMRRDHVADVLPGGGHQQ